MPNEPQYAQLVEFETGEGNKAYFVVGSETADEAVNILKKEPNPDKASKIAWRWAVRRETSEALKITKGAVYTL